MQILLYDDGSNGVQWRAALQKVLPLAEVRIWAEGDDTPADYAIVWKPPAAMLRGRATLKAIFNLGAGVDAILQLGDALPAQVPVVRLDDAGMALQMAEYVTHAVLRQFRRFDEFDAQSRDHHWGFLAPRKKADFCIGILGMGVLGARIAAALAHFDFPVRGWSRTRKHLPGVHSHAGDELDAFLAQSQLLVCILPLTAETRGMLDRATLAKLPKGAYLVNVARGAHVVERDLLTLIEEGHLAGAMLDVFDDEPLPADHAFWREPRITITPHVAALSRPGESVQQIAAKIKLMERGQPFAGLVDRLKGY